MRREGNIDGHYDATLRVLEEKGFDIHALDIRLLIETLDPLAGQTPNFSAMIIAHARLLWEIYCPDCVPMTKGYSWEKLFDMARQNISRIPNETLSRERGNVDHLLYPNFIRPDGRQY